MKSTPLKWIEPVFRKTQSDLVWNRDYSIEGHKKVVYANKGMVSFFDGSWKFGTAKMTFKHGKWFFHIPCTNEIEEPNLFDVKNVVGIDLGMNFITTSYDSNGQTQLYAGRFIKDKRNHQVPVYSDLRLSAEKFRVLSATLQCDLITQKI
jgi:transposase